MLVALRPGEQVENPHVARVAGAPAANTISPRPLSCEAVTALVTTTLGTEPEPEFSQACHATTAGNPFFLRVLLEDVAAQGIEPDVAQALRVRGLGPRAVSRAALLRLGSVQDGPALAAGRHHAVRIIFRLDGAANAAGSDGYTAVV